MAIGPELRNKKNKTHQIPTPTTDSQPLLLPDLPNATIFELLSRLPVKSLLRFRCVCKPWLSLVSDPQFVKFHLSIASKSGEFAHQRLSWSLYRPEYGFASCSIYSMLYEQSDNAVVLGYPLHGPAQNLWVRGSCNGLLCLVKGVSIHLWNPSMRQSRRLPDLGDIKGVVSSSTYGFGYVESSDDYKVVVISPVADSGGSQESLVNVYTLRTDLWRRIEDFTYAPSYQSGKFVNGSLHWETKRGNWFSNSPWVIVSLDLANDTFGEIAQPNYGGNCGDDSFILTLEVLNGCLYVLRNFHEIRVEVWVMKEYGLTESWTKLFTFPHLVYHGKYPRCNALCLLENGEILLLLSMGLYLYNPNDGTFRKPVIPSSYSMNMDTYIESLVSLNADNVVQM